VKKCDTESIKPYDILDEEHRDSHDSQDGTPEEEYWMNYLAEFGLIDIMRRAEGEVRKLHVPEFYDPQRIETED
jgi:exonuclease III